MNTTKSRLLKKTIWIRTLYVLVTGKPDVDLEHMGYSIMKSDWQALSKTKTLWLESRSRTKLISTMQANASKFGAIAKIICVGPGAINLCLEFYHYSLQHLTVFDIATVLEATYRSGSVLLKRIETKLQDPCYSIKDGKLLTKLSGK